MFILWLFFHITQKYSVVLYNCTKIQYIDSMEIIKCTTSKCVELQFADEGIRAGFPSPAQDFMEQALDFNRDMIKNPDATFYARVKGDSMIEENIVEGDILVIDRSIEPRDNILAVCAIDGEFTLKRLKITDNKIILLPANTSYQPITVEADQEFIFWGAVIYVIKKTY